jgi:hypothetical protein
LGSSICASPEVKKARARVDISASHPYIVSTGEQSLAVQMSAKDMFVQKVLR